MFGNMFGDLEERQEKMRQQLADITVEADAGNKAVVVSANGNGAILNIKIDKEKISTEDFEELEDLLVNALNDVLEKADEVEAEAVETLMGDMMPPSLGGLGDMFK